jgi:hypothetical protein
MDLTPGQIGWTAGVVDGEGCVGIYSRGRDRPDEFRLHVTVANTDERMLVRLRELWGGRYDPHSRRTKTNERQVWSWTVHDRAAGRLLETVLPHLVIKKEQAEIALEFVSLFGRGSARRTPENKERRIELAKQLKEAKTATFQVE